MPVNLYHTQKVRGFQQGNVKYLQNSVKIQLKRTKYQLKSLKTAMLKLQFRCHSGVVPEESAL